ncbi:hypothetical protein Zmor_006011 [Zophobas morio]|uniref:Uncharacterized protein n=1 Tax=Zophobas morio TaxID=2755281 RepID=A0AA38IU19_9CUCU|nr:hypothetical protein Zmor_006011 [Zophobas morio]
MAFIDSEIEVIIFIPKNEQTSTRTEKKEVDNEQNTLDEGTGHTLKSRSKYKNEAIILSPEENKSYKDILKTIRDTVELIDKSEDIKNTYTEIKARKCHIGTREGSQGRRVYKYPRNKNRRV